MSGNSFFHDLNPPGFLLFITARILRAVTYTFLTISIYDIADELKDIVPEVHVVGDAVRARRALDATKEAYDVALKL